MKGIRHTLFTLVALLAAALSVVSCQFRNLEHDGAELQISVYIPEVQLTKATTGMVDPLASEKVFSSLQIWVFLHEAAGTHSAGDLLGYRAFTDLANTGLSTSTVTRFGMPLSDELFTLLTGSGGSTRPTVDVYAVANAASAGVTLTDSSTKSDLDAAVIAGTAFGTSSLTHAVPASGLPMSGVLTGASVNGDYPVLNISTVTLKRAVCKVRFVFCQQARADAPTQPLNPNLVITGITLGGDIAQNEKLFTSADHDFSGTVTLNASIDPPATNAAIPVNADPTVFLKGAQGAQEYETMIETAVANNQLVECGLTYLRESGSKLSGSISYKLEAGGATKTSTFTMDADGDFYRNHSWIIFAYTRGASLLIRPFILPWEDVALYSFTTDGVVGMELENEYHAFDDHDPDAKWYFRYQIGNTDFNDWINSAIAVSSEINAEGAPIYSTPIKITCNKRNALRLQSDNNAFQFVEYSQSDGYSAVKDYIEIPSGPQNIVFYVVPTGDFSSALTSRKAAVSLVTIAAPGEASIKTPYNTSIFPGAEDNTDVYFYYVPVSTIRDYADPNVALPGNVRKWDM